VRRTSFLVAVVVLAGCAGGPVSSTPTATPTDTPAAPLTGSSQPDPDKQVTLENEWNETVTLDVRVVRVATGETVHEATYDLGPGVERDVYSTAAANPDGIESFRVEVRARNQTGEATIETSNCYGGVYGVVRGDGSLNVFYPIC
jgi:hypothetical protein